MKIRHYKDAPATEPKPGLKKRVLIGPEEGAQNFIMRIFEVGPGLTSPKHAHPWEHEVFVLSGEGVACDGNGKETAIGEGTVLFIPAGETHCLINQGKGVLRFLCMIPAGVE